MDYLIGKVIDNRYEIVETVGTGGMATVYKAKCKVLDRFVAIKVLKDSLKHDIEVVKKFNTESRAAARLSHPNIVQVYDVSESGELDYIVMEYVDGITLKEYIANKGHLEPEEACDIAAQIGRALVCAHSNGVVHRDIKPHNVLMAPDGTMKVADFGIAQATTSETLVAGSSAMGSVHYIAPEQARGGFTNERSDIYSLGVVLYEMLTGTVPFDGANPVAVALAKLENDAEDLREKCEHDIPKKVCEITMKAISKDQHSRYQSAAEMVADLEGVIGVGATSRGAENGKFETKRLDGKKTKEEYDMRKTKKRKKDNKLKLAIFAGIAVVLLGVLTYCSMTGGSQEYQVPEILNLTVEEAEEVLKNANLRLNGNIEYEESDEVEEGKIIRQTPGANQYVKKNRKIKITVSLGSDVMKIDVPNVVNLKAEEAQMRLKEKGFTYVVEEEFSDTIEVGYVIRQTPESGNKAAKGSEVTIYVSGEEEQIIVPKVTGMSQGEAIRMIEAAGLTVGDITTGESDDEVGIVIGQSPAAKVGVEKGTKVDIMISEGAGIEPTPTPTTSALKKKTLTITIPKEGGETVNIRAVANGKEIYNKNHKRAEGSVDIPVQSSKDASVQVYIDGNLAADKVIYFD